MSASLVEDYSKVLFGTDEFKGYVDTGIKSIAPLLIGRVLELLFLFYHH
ncbi:MAG: hypothetical protein ACRD8Z_08055 [Nitrososphaeraceae archaeon]